MTQETQNNQPVAEVRDRDIRVAIWKNPTKDGTSYRFSASLPERRYEVEGEWKTARSFNREEYLRIGHLCGKVVDRISELYQELYDSNQN